MKKFFLAFIITILSSFTFTASAATTSILPGGGEDDIAQYLTIEQCSQAVDEWTLEYEANNKIGLHESIQVEGWDITMKQMLGCALKSGKIKFWMITYFVANALEFLLGLSGLIAVLMILVGAYFYIAGGLTDDKEKGKTIMKYALGGFILTILSWFIVNVILLAVTG